MAAAVREEIIAAVGANFQPQHEEPLSAQDQYFILTAQHGLGADAARRIRMQLVETRAQETGYRFDHARQALWLRRKLTDEIRSLPKSKDRDRVEAFAVNALGIYKFEVAAWAARHIDTYEYGRMVLETAKNMTASGDFKRAMHAYRNGTFGKPGSFVAGLAVPAPAAPKAQPPKPAN